MTIKKLAVAPSSVGCRNCNARPGAKCTQPNDNGRYAVNWFHHIREYDAQVATREAREREAAP